MRILPSSKSISRSDGLSYAVALATTFIVLAAVGYRPFPSIDDFAYIPLARSWLNQSLYSTDLFLQETVFHLPLWALFVSLFVATLGLATGFWILTILLSLITILAMLHIMRALGVAGLLLPIATIVALCGHIQGLGRGQYDGAFGEAFHMQWMALAFLLWSYNAFIRGNATIAGTMLGLTGLAHPVVGFHGVLVFAFASLFVAYWRWRPLTQVAIITAFISSPVSLPLAYKLLINGTKNNIPINDIIELGYLFRAPHEFAPPHTLILAVFIVIVCTGLAGIAALNQQGSSDTIKGITGLFFGHIILATVAVLIQYRWLPDGLLYSTLPYQLSLTRTTPILVVLSMLIMISALEHELAESTTPQGQQPQHRPLRIGWILFWTCSLMSSSSLLLIQVSWHAILFVGIILCLITFFLRNKNSLRPLLSASWLLLGAIGFTLYLTQNEIEAVIPPEQAKFHAWVRRSTPPESIFIIPPGYQSFRFYTERGTYVDFKLFPASTLRMIPEWRRRLEQISAPDRLALKATGWPAIPEWDRTYANRNTPKRIAELLEETQADFFVWDKKGLETPPFVTVNRQEDPRLELVFQNERYEVYRLKKNGYDEYQNTAPSKLGS